PGDEVPFKVVQRCQEGQMAWIELADGSGEEPEYPAPILTLTAAGDDGHGHSDSGTEGDSHGDSTAALAADEDGVGPEQDASSGEDGDGPLPVIALIISIVALLTAGAALAKRRAG